MDVLLLLKRCKSCELDAIIVVVASVIDVVAIHYSTSEKGDCAVVVVTAVA